MILCLLFVHFSKTAISGIKNTLAYLAGSRHSSGLRDRSQEAAASLLAHCSQASRPLPSQEGQTSVLGSHLTTLGEAHIAVGQGVLADKLLTNILL